jgi:hypothetical protein
MDVQERCSGCTLYKDGVATCHTNKPKRTPSSPCDNLSLYSSTYFTVRLTLGQLLSPLSRRSDCPVEDA